MKRLLFPVLLALSSCLSAPAFAAPAECASNMGFSEGKAQLEAAGVKVAQVPTEAAVRAVHDYNEANGSDEMVTAVYLATMGPIAKIVFVNGDCVVFATPAIPLQRALDLLGLSAS